MSKTMFPGFSIVIAVGKWCNPSIKKGSVSFRVCLGFVAISFWTLDIERLHVKMAEELS